MKTFEASLSASTWTEVLDGKSSIAFDIVEARRVEVYLTETADDPGSVTGSYVECWPNSWDFQATGLIPGVQRLWARGDVTIRGVRS